MLVIVMFCLGARDVAWPHVNVRIVLCHVVGLHDVIFGRGMVLYLRLLPPQLFQDMGSQLRLDHFKPQLKHFPELIV